MPSPTSSRTAERFSDEYSAALQGVRGALDRLVRAAGGDPTRPQDLARDFGVNRTLTWRASRLLATEDPVEALRFLPGTAALRILREALAAGTDGEAAAELARAEEVFEAMVARHAGDRTHLEILVQDLASGRTLEEPLEQHRRQSLVANSSLWGVRAATQLALFAVAPSTRDPGRADLLSVSGLVDFGRLRSDASWLFFSSQAYDSSRPGPRATHTEPIEPPPGGADSAPLLADFCSDPTPELQRLVEPGEVRYELPPGPIGNTALLTACYGVVERSVGTVLALPGETDATATIGTNLLTPVEHAQVDLLVHEALGWNDPPEFALVGRMDGHTEFTLPNIRRRQLPSVERVVRLGRGCSGLASARYPRSPELARHCLGRLDWDPERFVAWRVSIACPPIPTTAQLLMRIPPPDAD